MISLSLSTSRVDIKTKGASEFIDIFANLQNKTSININKLANWKTSNQDVAVAYDGRILAFGKGSTTIPVSYGGISNEISVNVGEDRASKIFAFSLTPSEKDSIYMKCSAMVNQGWTPTRDLSGWKNEYTFKANTLYFGIPYSQTPNQKDESGFISSMNNSDFYSTYYDGRYMPRYGSDCSGFTSFAWGISRHTTTDFIDGIANGKFPKVGNYNVNNPSQSDLLNSYKLLQSGDAVVTYGHAFVIAGLAWDTTYQCFEQTPYRAITSYWTAAQLANGNYRPFSKK